MADYYELLGVPRNANPDDLKKAYRKRARELHPDANPGDPAAEEQFKLVARAYEVLSDAQQRARYDRFGEQGLGGAASGDPFGFSQGGGLGDIFEAFFGGAGGQRGRGPTGPPRGQDLEAVADLTFEQAVFGAEVPVSVRTAVACAECSGRGTAPGTSPVTCVECAGVGQVERIRSSVFGQVVTASPCTRCRGLGQVIVTPCPACNGEGRIIEEKSYRVDVPAGVGNGSTLRLTGRGAVGPRGGPPGDLYVHLRVRSHERFSREGDDLVSRLPVSFAQAALGTHVVFATLDGDEDLVIPAGTQHGRVFRLRGRGVPRVDGRGRGDLLVEVTVDTPTKLTKTQEELLRRFAEERGDQVAPQDTSFLGRIKSAFK